MGFAGYSEFFYAAVDALRTTLDVKLLQHVLLFEVSWVVIQSMLSDQPKELWNNSIGNHWRKFITHIYVAA